MKRKKGSGIIGYVLATMFFVAIAIMVITYSSKSAEERVEKTVILVSGKMDCQQIRLDVDAFYADPFCTVHITNKGTLTIDQVLIRYGGSQEEVKELKLEQVLIGDTGVGYKEVQFAWNDKISVLPVLEVEGGLIGCKDKTLIATCA